MAGIIDSREPAYFRRKLPDWEVRTLEVGDFIVGDLVIERKELSDLVSSVYDGRYAVQLSNLASVGEDNNGLSPLLIVEGTNYNFSLKGRKKVFDSRRLSLLSGVFSSIVVKYGISVVPSPNKSFTVELLKKMDDKSGGVSSGIDQLKKRFRMSFPVSILMSIEGVGIKRAMDIAELIMLENQYTSEEEITLADIVAFFSRDDVKINGVGNKTIEKIRRRVGVLA